MSILKTFGKVARIIIGLAYLLIGSCIIIFGVANGVNLGLDTISGLVFIVSTGLLGVVIINGGIKKLRDPTLEKHYASMLPEDIEKEKKKSRRNSIGCLIVIVFIIFIIISTSYLEIKAKGDAESFCAPINIGDPIEPVKELALTVGSNMLRTIEENEVTVGFIGIPPFSRHLCIVKSENGKITEKKYFYLD